ncbi:MAG TPA: hypothetical protein VIF62_28090 [Labilithrix sp.]
MIAGCGGEAMQDDGAVSGDDALTSDWTPVGTGVAYKNTGSGAGVWIGYAGYSVKDTWSCAWTTELDRVRLGRLGIGHLYCVQGPRDASYAGKEIGNSKLAAHLAAGPGPDAPFVLVAAHSSGAYVADELLRDLPAETLAKVVYANLDGGGIDASLVSGMKHAAFVYAQDTTLDHGLSANAGFMQSLGSEFHSPAIRVRQDHSGCDSGAKWCLHDLVITTKPHDASTFDLHDDYTDFAGHPVQTAWIDAVASYLDQ